MEKPMFSLGELLVLLDVDEIPALSSPLPTNDQLRAVVQPLRFRTGLNHLYAPPQANLSFSPAMISLSLRSFPHPSIWENMSGWIAGYLTETLSKAPKSAGPSGYRAFKGHGIVALWSYTKPTGNNSYDLALWLNILRAEPPLETVLALFGLATDAPVGALDANWRTLASVHDMHVEASCIDDTLRLRCQAARHDTLWSSALKCQMSCIDWLQLWSPFGGGTAVGAVRRRALETYEHAAAYQYRTDTLLAIAGTTTRRDSFELHVPKAWVAASHA